MAMRKYQRTDRDAEIVLHMAAIPGVSHESIAFCVTNARTGKPISAKTLRKHFGPELERGMATMQKLVMESFVEQIKAHNWPATRLGLANYCGLRDNGEIQVNANIDNSLEVRFVPSPNSGQPIPGPLDLKAEQPAQLPPPIPEPDIPSAPHQAEPAEAPRTEFDLSDEERLAMGLPVLRYKRKSRAPYRGPLQWGGKKLDGLTANRVG